MGLYAIDCYICGSPFMWFSGNMPDQRCQSCKDKGYVTKEDKDKADEIQQDSKETT